MISKVRYYENEHKDLLLPIYTHHVYNSKTFQLSQKEDAMSEHSYKKDLIMKIMKVNFTKYVLTFFDDKECSYSKNNSKYNGSQSTC